MGKIHDQRKNKMKAIQQQIELHVDLLQSISLQRNGLHDLGEHLDCKIEKTRTVLRGLRLDLLNITLVRN